MSGSQKDMTEAVVVDIFCPEHSGLSESVLSPKKELIILIKLQLVSRQLLVYT